MIVGFELSKTKNFQYVFMYKDASSQVWEDVLKSVAMIGDDTFGREIKKKKKTSKNISS